MTLALRPVVQLARSGCGCCALLPGSRYVQQADSALLRERHADRAAFGIFNCGQGRPAFAERKQLRIVSEELWESAHVVQSTGTPRGDAIREAQSAHCCRSTEAVLPRSP